VEINARLIDYKGNKAILAVARDITERKRAEDALKESENKYRQLAENVTDVIWTMGMDLKFTYISPSNAHMTGFSNEEAMALTLKDILTPSSLEMSIQVLAEELKIEKMPQKDLSRSRTFEAEEICKDGHTIWVEITTAFLRNHEGQPIGIQGISRDISERKRMEEELLRSHCELEQRVKDRTEELARKNAEMERFIYTVSHDLRTPLISVSGFLGLIKQDAEEGDLKRLDTDLRIVGEAVTKMDRLLQDTLELSRIGRIVNPPEDVPFVEIVEDALSQTREKIKSKRVKVTVAMDLPAVHVDRMRIAEVLINLIENSIKYMGSQDRPEIEIGQRIEGTKQSSLSVTTELE
jgi:PAS domain S-box-containing protein